MNARILIYGYGAMASAMVEGWIASGITPDRFTIYNPRRKTVPDGATFTDMIPLAPFEVVLLGFKPHMLGGVAPDMQRCVSAQTCVLSILAGAELGALREMYPDAASVVRFMPNLAVALGKSPNALIGEGLSPDQHEMVTELATRLGSAEWLEDETLFNLVTALAGSGPAFVYRFIDALAAGASSLGLSEEQAQRLATQMVEGAGALAAASSESPRDLAARVASPGGMTQEGLDVLDSANVLNDLMRKTLKATCDRGAELAEQARKKG